MRVCGECADGGVVRLVCCGHVIAGEGGEGGEENNIGGRIGVGSHYGQTDRGHSG